MSPIDLRFGRWQDALTDVGEVDAVITDPPYSKRTHNGSAQLSSGKVSSGISAYQPWTKREASAFVHHWSPRCRGWIVIHTDDELGVVIRRLLEDQNRYTFPLVPVVQHMPRIQGDGPGSPGHFLVVARPRAREWSKWGSLPGSYEAPREKNGEILGCKPLGLMRAIVRDYTRPGDFVVDPFAGSGTTAIACRAEGRRCVTAEALKDHYEIARRRVDAPYTPTMFDSVPAVAQPLSLFGDK